MKKYLILIIVFIIAVCSIYLAGVFDYFYISAFDTQECAAWALGDGDTIEKVNPRLLYASIGNIALITLVFIVLRFLCKLAISRYNLVPLIICLMLSAFLVGNLYTGRALGIETIKKCEYVNVFPKLYYEGFKEINPFNLPSNLKLQHE